MESTLSKTPKYFTQQPVCAPGRHLGLRRAAARASATHRPSANLRASRPRHIPASRRGSFIAFFESKESTLPRITGERLSVFKKVLDDYDQAFLHRDIAALRKLYSSDGEITFFDNHSECDSFDIDDHINRAQAFFLSGTMVNISSENLIVYENAESACIIVKHRYSNRPKPGVRATYFLEKDNSEWKIRHIHCSFDPNEG